MAEHVTLEYTEYGDRSYLSEKDKHKHPKRLALEKYCPVEKKVALRHETE